MVFERFKRKRKKKETVETTTVAPKKKEPKVFRDFSPAKETGESPLDGGGSSRKKKIGSDQDKRRKLTKEEELKFQGLTRPTGDLSERQITELNKRQSLQREREIAGFGSGGRSFEEAEKEKELLAKQKEQEEAGLGALSEIEKIKAEREAAGVVGEVPTGEEAITGEAVPEERSLAEKILFGIDGTIDPATGEKVKIKAGTVPLGAGAAAKAGAAIKGISTFLKARNIKIAASATAGLSKAFKFTFGKAGGVAVGAATGVAAVELAPIVGKRFTSEDRRIKSIEADIGVMSEDIPTTSSLVLAGGDPIENYEALLSFEDDLDTYEETIKVLELGSDELKTNPEFTSSLKRRFGKQRRKIDASKLIIETYLANPNDPRLAQLQLSLESIQ